jgi:hypothetical protein
MTGALSKELPDYKMLVDLKGNNLHYDSFPTQWLNSSTDLKPDLIIVPPNNAPIIIGELTSPMLPSGHERMESKEGKEVQR